MRCCNINLQYNIKLLMFYDTIYVYKLRIGLHDKKLKIRETICKLHLFLYTIISI